MLLLALLVLATTVQSQTGRQSKRPSAQKADQTSNAIAVDLLGPMLRLASKGVHPRWRTWIEYERHVFIRSAKIGLVIGLEHRHFEGDYSGPFSLYQNTDSSTIKWVQEGWYLQNNLSAAPGIRWHYLQLDNGGKISLSTFLETRFTVDYRTARITPDFFEGGINTKQEIGLTPRLGSGALLKLGTFVGLQVRLDALREKTLSSGRSAWRLSPSIALSLHF